jgi:multiple sugar transport system permease protein
MALRAITGSRISSARRRRSLIALLFVSPALILFLVFLGFQVVFAFYMTFNKWSVMRPPVWVGLNNFARILRDDLLWTSIRISWTYTAMYVPAVVAAALVVALLLNGPIKGRYVFKALSFIPVLTGWTIVGVIWFFIYQPERGILNLMLRMVGLPHEWPWLGERITVLPALVMVAVWKNFGYYAVLFLAGLQEIPPSLHEAAAIDGASRFQSLVRITLPLLRPTIGLVSVLAVIAAFGVFDLVFVMTEGAPALATHVFNYYIYLRAFKSFQMGYASSMAFVLFAVVLVLTLIQLRILRPATEA